MKKLWPLLVFVLACGSGQEESQTIPQPVPAETAPATQTPYGNTDRVQIYLESINPFVQEVGKIQLEIDKMVGSSGQATGKNLAEAMEIAMPRLRQAITDFDKISPPPLLSPLHNDIKKLMVLRLTGYETTIRGWAREQQDGSVEAYSEAEGNLREANQLIGTLNQEMAKVFHALEQASQPEQTTAH